jgi:hypothetical protein
MYIYPYTYTYIDEGGGGGQNGMDGKGRDQREVEKKVEEEVYT